MPSRHRQKHSLLIRKANRKTRNGKNQQGTAKADTGWKWRYLPINDPHDLPLFPLISVVSILHKEGQKHRAIQNGMRRRQITNAELICQASEKYIQEKVVDEYVIN